MGSFPFFVIFGLIGLSFYFSSLAHPLFPFFSIKIIMKVYFHHHRLHLIWLSLTSFIQCQMIGKFAGQTMSMVTNPATQTCWAVAQNVIVQQPCNPTVPQQSFSFDDLSTGLMGHIYTTTIGYCLQVKDVLMHCMFAVLLYLICLLSFLLACSF